jgi:UDP-3-O-[3-hydroxymyristoyl] glucosamine N-acyltransferase
MLGGTLTASSDREVRGIAQVDDVRDDEVTFVDDPKFAALLEGKDPAAVIVGAVLAQIAAPQIVVANPRLAAVQTAMAFVAEPTYEPGAAPGALVDAAATIEPTATIMPGAYVGPGARVGAKTVLMPQAYVGPDAVVGANCVLHPGSNVGARCVLGDRVICHFGVAIGADGFGYYPLDGQHAKVPQLGIVVIGDDVEIGANSCIDRATFGRTVIGAGTKIDNQVHIAHNCLIGKRCLVVAQVGLAGSVVVGDDTILAARAAAVSHARIGNHCIVGGQASVLKNMGDGEMVGGVPAKNHMDWKREVVALGKLPAALRTLRRLENKVAELSEEKS